MFAWRCFLVRLLYRSGTPPGSLGLASVTGAAASRACTDLFVHCKLILLHTSGELVRNFDRFSTNASPFSSLILSPYAHMSHSVVSTPGVLANSCTSIIFHDVAFFGCSCRKCLPPFSCIPYSSKQNFMCFLAISIFRLNSSSSRFALLMFCNVLNIVHGGDPINMNGLESRTSSFTLALTSFLLRSHG